MNATRLYTTQDTTEARAEVIGALCENQLTIPAADAAAVGQLEVSVAEVDAVLKDATPGKSPGLAFLLSFTKLAGKNTQHLWQMSTLGFLEGVTTVLYKDNYSLKSVLEAKRSGAKRSEAEHS